VQNGPASAIPSLPAAGAADQMSLASLQRGRPSRLPSTTHGSMGCSCMIQPPSRVVRFSDADATRMHSCSPLPLGTLGLLCVSSPSVACGRKSSLTHHVGTRQTFAALGGDPVPWSVQSTTLVNCSCSATQPVRAGCHLLCCLCKSISPHGVMWWSSKRRPHASSNLGEAAVARALLLPWRRTTA
jgi:hypothetical protein